MSLDFGDSTVMLYAWIVVIGTCAALDLPAIAAALRFFRLRWRLAYARGRGQRCSI